MNLVLIGYRGTGKSTVARLLAGLLGWDWVDSDVEVELRAAKSIAALFADDGEEVFRDLETAVLQELLGWDKTVVAAGGGAVLRPENRRTLRRATAVVWLRAEPATILERIQSDASTAGRRPNLTTRGGEAEVVELLARRTPWYRECADEEIDTEGKDPSAIAAEIAAGLRQRGVLPREK